MRKLLLGAATFALLGAAPVKPITIAEIDALVAEPALTPASAADVTSVCDAKVAMAVAFRKQIENEKGAAAIEVFRRYDALSTLLNAAGNDSGLVAEVAPDDARRDAARACSTRVDTVRDTVSLSPPIYARLKAIPESAVDAPTRYLLNRELANFDRSGVPRDAATRATIAAIKTRISALGTQFDANIANGRLTVTAAPAELDGLPADYLAAHRPGPDGKVTISTDYPDYVPVMSYAKNAALRQRLYMAFYTRAYPANSPVLAELITRRDELARLLGRPDHATLALEDKMIANPTHARTFLAEVAGATDVPARRDYARMLTRARVDDPALASVPAWSASYLRSQIKKESYNLDPQEVRQYFAYDHVRDGILQLTRDLFGVEIRPWKTAVWDNAVEAYEMLDGGKVIGRFYFDPHPRPGKYGHANVVPIRMGLSDRAIPVAALVTNFPTGLMEHRDVETFLHEYGHLIHAMFSGRQPYEAGSMGNVEWDFIEAPSQMLENWVWNYDTLKRFAINAKGETIPADLVERINKARYFARAYSDKQQIGFANLSLALYSGNPPTDIEATAAAAYDRYSLIPTVPGTHGEASFNHLNGYSAYYYTYMWSLTIADDLFTAFETKGLRDLPTAKRYRDLVLAQGGAKPAATLVHDFLGRDFSIAAYRAQLDRGQ